MMKRGDESIEHTYANTCHKQDDNNHDKKKGKGHSNIAEHQSPESAGAPGRAGMADLAERHVPGDDTDQPEAKRQDVQY